ncbi:MAG: SDR family NAD(P)-dependent oxidoreductase [Clostridium sp.]|nr:SDR family NAD(P)-dependent oxidoreductase [Clostridium sp.]
MTNQKVCISAGKTGAKEYSMLEKYASQGCRIAFMDTNKELGRDIKAELERLYNARVFFFHGNVESEEDRDIFFAAVQEMYGRMDYILWPGE